MQCHFEPHQPVQCSVCLLHMNELTLRHLFCELNGTTTGPKSFADALDSQLQNCHNMVEFTPTKNIFDENSSCINTVTAIKLHLWV